MLCDVKYQPERSRAYLGSPSIVRLPDGALIMSHDYFGPGSPKSRSGRFALSSIYRSEDDGASWQNIGHIMNCFWGTLFVHDGALYILGTDQQFGSIVIHRSDNGGFNWTHPADASTGLLFRGGEDSEGANYHCAPVPVTIHNGRIYKAFEDCSPRVWGNFQALVLSAPVAADLLDASNWTMSNKIAFNPDWLPTNWDASLRVNWREGNVIADPQGQLWDILVADGPVDQENVCRIRIEQDGRHIVFDHVTGFVEMPGSKSKFTIRRDPISGEYLSLVNAIDDVELLRQWSNIQGRPIRQRNNVYLIASRDLWTWRRARKIISDDSGLRLEDSIRLSGFQYLDWQFDGDADIIFAVRTAHRGASDYHDSNRIQFGTIRGFRKYLAV